jgi:predicted pyridoxine 5'-phosphate oxidase superfamily flavin-nucleotide-binding protein
MGARFAEIAFTPSVKAAQARYGARAMSEHYGRDPDRGDTLTDLETEFIRQRDSFYQATVAETGWPYVQFRGGPTGFLHVIDDRTVGYADFRGNRQYVSVGNITADERIALILLDYPRRRRLKILGRATVVDRTNDPTRVGALEVPGYRARVERGVIIAIEAFDWNCPQHIKPRFTEDEVMAVVNPLRKRVAELEDELARQRNLSEL